MLLRLTGEVLDSVVGYAYSGPESESRDDPAHLLVFLDDLDKAWFAVLRNQVWDSDESIGKDVEELRAEVDAEPKSKMDVVVNGDTSTSMDIDLPPSQRTSELYPNQPASSTSLIPSISQTDRTRLRSLLIAGTEILEEWLPPIISIDDSNLDVDSDPDADTDMQEIQTTGREQTRTKPENLGMKELTDAMDERAMFNDLFWRTLTEMGELS
jgi:hypothetical protein